MMMMMMMMTTTMMPPDAAGLFSLNLEIRKKISSLKIVPGIFYMCFWSGFQRTQEVFSASERVAICAVSFGVSLMESVTTVRLFRNTCQARCFQPESYVRGPSAVLRALCAALAAVDSLWP